MEPKTEVIFLENNFKCLLIPLDNIKVIQFSLFLKIGEDNEPLDNPNKYEIAHLLEHLFGFFTSKKYPNGKKNLKNIENLGIDSGAEVMATYTKYYLKGLLEYSDFMLDLLCNCYDNFKIDKSIISQEKMAVIEELNDILNGTWINLKHKNDKMLFKNHPRSISQDDKKKNVPKIKIKDILEFYEKYYNNHNTLLTVCGNISKKTIESIKKTFGRIKNRGTPAIYPVLKRNRNYQISYVPNKRTNATNLFLFFKINLKPYDTESSLYKFISTLLSYGLQSILNRTLRIEKGLIYSIVTELDLSQSDKNMGYFIFNTTAEYNKIPSVLLEIFKILTDFKKKNRNIVDINRVKNIYKLEYQSNILNRQPDNFTDIYSYYILWNKKIVSLRQRLKKLMNITSKDIKLLSNEIFTKDNLVITYSGKKNITPEINKIVEKYF